MIILLFMLNTSYALSQLKVCSNCKHFFVEKNIDNTLQAKCLYFKKIHPNREECIKRKETNYLVLGDIVQKIVDERDLYFCLTARIFENMCGYEAKKYESRNENKTEKVF